MVAFGSLSTSTSCTKNNLPPSVPGHAAAVSFASSGNQTALAAAIVSRRRKAAVFAMLSQESGGQGPQGKKHKDEAPFV